MLVSNLWSEEFRFDFFTLLVVAVIIYIPLTVLWAIISTFLINDKEQGDNDILD